MTVKIESLSIYPIKSCSEMKVSEFTLAEQGPEVSRGNQAVGDRQWMWVNSSGNLLTQREIPQLSLLRPDFDGDQFLIHFPNHKIQAISSDERKNVRVWGNEVNARLWHISDIEWVHQFLGQEAYLVQFDQSSKREATAKGEGLGVQTRFTDSQPLLVLNQDSLKELNVRMQESIPMSRFRGNIEISGAPAFAEDHWLSLKNDKLELKASKACGRCVIININQENKTDQVEKSPEALKTLAQFRKKENAIFFGQYFHTFSFGQTLKLGDELRIQD